MTNWTEIDEIAKKWIREAGARIKQSMHESLTIETKSNPNDLVTNIDKETEKFSLIEFKKRFRDTAYSVKKGKETNSTHWRESSGLSTRLTGR
ncbi:inositol monophosphatase family protein [Bacillus stercoris]|nr:inositol monophosphatase family protein [Bacillus stercoris]